MIPPPTSPPFGEDGTLFRALFHAHPLPMWVHDPESGHIRAVNPATAEFLGRPDAELLAMKPPELEAAAVALALEVTAHPLEAAGNTVVLYAATLASGGGSGDPARVRAWYRRALESSADGLVIADRDRNVEFMNPEAERLLGQSRDALVGKRLCEAIPWLAGSELEGRVRQALEEERPSEFEVTFGDPARTFAIRGYPILHGVALFLRDVTERRASEERLRLQASLLDAVGQAVIAADRDRRIHYWNPAAERLHGWKSEEVLGQDLLEVIPVDASRPELAEILCGVLRGEAWEGQIELGRREGPGFPALVTTSPIRDPSGSVQGTIAVASDATERIEFEQRVRQVQKMEAVGRLAGGIAHDFNNVLTVILGRARLLLEDLPATSSHREDVEQIIGGAERAASLTSRLLAFGRSQVLHERVVDLATMVQEMESLLRPLLPARIDLEFRIEEDRPAARVDPVQLQQVLLNLAINARDAIDETGTITFRLESRTWDEARAAAMPWEMAPGEYAVLSVEDTGTGIPPELHDRIFEPFFTTKPEGQGTGLGLSMVYGMMKQSGGFVLVDSEPGQGTAFRLLFPRSDERPEEAPGPRSPSASASAGGRTILVVEDDPPVRTVIRRTLERAGHRVRVAADGAEALASFEEDPAAIDLIVSDLVMPGMSGGELVRTLQARGYSPKVILATGYSESEVAPGDRTPSTAFLAKPFTPAELMGLVEEVLAL